MEEEIFVEWGPPPESEQNGVITLYTVQFQSPSDPMPVNQTTASLNLSLPGLFPGVTYNISVAAHTAVGPGPFSDVLQQETLAEPPPFPDVPIPEPPRETITTSAFTFEISVPPGTFR